VLQKRGVILNDVEVLDLAHHLTLHGNNVSQNALHCVRRMLRPSKERSIPHWWLELYRLPANQSAVLVLWHKYVHHSFCVPCRLCHMSLCLLLPIVRIDANSCCRQIRMLFLSNVEVPFEIAVNR
jgi:hypothetical protein